jgi:hypothetical protein
MKTERVYACLFVLMFLGKMLHLPVSGLIIILTGCVTALSYFFAGFYFFCDEQLKRQNIVLSVIAGICLSVVPLAITYRLELEFWPYSDFLLLVSAILSLFILVLTWFLKKSAKEELNQYYKNMFSRSLALFIVSVALYIIPVTFIIKTQYWDNDELAQIAVRFAAHPDNDTCRKEYEHYLKTHTPSGKLIKIVESARPADNIGPKTVK